MFYKEIVLATEVVSSKEAINSMMQGEEISSLYENAIYVLNLKPN